MGQGMILSCACAPARKKKRTDAAAAAKMQSRVDPLTDF